MGDTFLICIVPPSYQGSKTIVEDRAERFEEPEAVDDYREVVFQTQQGICTYELIAVVTTCTRHVQVHTTQIPSEAKAEQGSWDKRNKLQSSTVL